MIIAPFRPPCPASTSTHRRSHHSAVLQVREAERRADLLTLAAAVGDPALVTPHRALLLQKDFGMRTNRRTSFARRASLGGGPAAKGRLWLCASWPRRRPPSPTTPPAWCLGLRPSQGRKGSPLTTTRCTHNTQPINA